MLASTCSIRRRIVTGVKLRSRAFTPRKRLPFTATVPPAMRPSCRHRPPGSQLMFASKVGDGLDIRCELARHPHQLDVAARLALQASARRSLI